MPLAVGGAGDDEPKPGPKLPLPDGSGGQGDEAIDAPAAGPGAVAGPQDEQRAVVAPSAGLSRIVSSVNPLLKRALEKLLLPAGRWLIKQVGFEWILKRIEQAVDGIGQRQKAVLKARSITGGRFGSTIIEERTRWVVYAGEEPRAVFPSIKGDLAEEMRAYDISRLRRPDELWSAQTRAWAGTRFRTLRERLRRGDVEDDRADDPTTPSAVRTEEPSTTVGRSSEHAGRPESTGDGGGQTVAATVEEQLGQRAFNAMIRRMPAMLDALSACPAHPVAEHPSLPAAPGIYVFSDGPNPLYVGNTRNLRRRLRQHVGETSRETQASFAWRLALKEAADAGDERTGTRKEMEIDPRFARRFMRARERVAGMDVRFIEIDDPIVRTLFEVYAAQALGTDEFNSFEAH
jgi:predicted GIY-YIG superfamily endonuclease